MSSCFTHEKNNLEYARAYILPQKYKNLICSVDEAFRKGTIFEDLYKPYKEKK
ncbi:spore coat associated protein CotJA [Clostridium fallax]|uniref:Spore coat associated protein JA (CotJA) n=1 Tax=Clostridium fallax TaxID=1533 RepID=A0A1M4XV83_9CLOT|nr:spore coat associated protein CotJA [Clostridium fallax]SHE97487.1 Spore coat associated protein JA (CotJA) [Clostridium fallax]SQB06514.1 spore coat associated protein [Clostridium fallax]